MERWKVYISFFDGGGVEKTVEGKPDDERLAALIQEEMQNEEGDDETFFSFTLDVVDRNDVIQQEEFMLEFSLSEDLFADGSVSVGRDLPVA